MASSSLRLRHVALATQALFLIFLITTPDFVLGGGGGGGHGKKPSGGGKKPAGGGKKPAGGGNKKPAAPYRPHHQPAGGGNKKPAAPYRPPRPHPQPAGGPKKPAAPYRPPHVQARPHPQPAGGGPKKPAAPYRPPHVQARPHPQPAGGGPKKPAAPYRPPHVQARPHPQPAGGGPKKPAAPYRPPHVQAKPTAPAANIQMPGPGTGGPAGPASKGNGQGIIYHGGPLLTGEVNLSIIFYGQFVREHKDLIRSFLTSFEVTEPGTAVSKWWDIVEGYQSVANVKNPKGIEGIKIKVGTQQSDDKASFGKVVTKDYIKMLVKKADSGKPNTLAVIFAAKDVAVSDLCRGKCYDHGHVDNFPYLIVGNPEIECPGSCAWPFVKNDYGPPGITVKPPNGDAGVDAIIVNFASGLASAVTNPFNTAFSKPGPKTWQIEAGNACEGIFGSGASPGKPGNILTDPAGGAYNAVGERGLKFLIPGVWDPKTSTCWTPM